jgi:hypothetical protein
MFIQAGGTNTHPNQCLTRTVKDKLLNGNGFFYAFDMKFLSEMDNFVQINNT